MLLRETLLSVARASAMTALMSTSLNVVSMAALCWASTSRLAMVARRLDMRSRCSDRVAGRDWAGAGRRGAGAGAVPVPDGAAGA